MKGKLAALDPQRAASTVRSPGRLAPRVLVILPTYNEAANVESVIRRVRQQGCDVLVVDDSSPDGTANVVRRLSRTDSGVELLSRPAKLGLGSAYVAGLALGLARGYDLLVEMDADGSHSPQHLAAMIAAAQAGNGLVIGSRYSAGGSIGGWGWPRRLLSAGANLFCYHVLGLPVRDSTSGYRCYTQEALRAAGLEQVLAQGYAFQVEMVHRCRRSGSTIREIAIDFQDRATGCSKMTWSDIREAIETVLLMAWHRMRGTGA
jgi:dolichol-phosphate mannosyltransferase